MRSWEYYIFTYDGDKIDPTVYHADNKNMPLNDYLDFMGDRGWELIGVSSDANNKRRLFLKRPKEQ